MAVLFGHQGGWDEALMVLVPIGLFIGLLWLANKRAKAIQAKRLAQQGETPEVEQPQGPSTGNDQ